MKQKKLIISSFILKDLQLNQYKNYKAVKGKLKISDLSSNEERILNPEIRIYDNPQTLTYEALFKQIFLETII